MIIVYIPLKLAEEVSRGQNIFECGNGCRSVKAPKVDWWYGVAGTTDEEMAGYIT